MKIIAHIFIFFCKNILFWLFALGLLYAINAVDIRKEYPSSIPNISQSHCFGIDYESLRLEISEITKEGVNLWSGKQYEDAVPVLEQAKLMWEKLPIIERYGNYGITLVALASSILNIAIKNDSNLFDLIYALNLSELSVEDFDYCRRFDENNANTCYQHSSTALNVMGVTYRHIGNFDKAKESFQEAIKRNPQNYVAVRNLNNL